MLTQLMYLLKKEILTPSNFLTPSKCPRITP